MLVVRRIDLVPYIMAASECLPLQDFHLCSAGTIELGPSVCLDPMFHRAEVQSLQSFQT